MPILLAYIEASFHTPVHKGGGVYCLVCYDVNTEKKEGRRRLRRVAQVCKNFGQRAQYSVFEVNLTPVQHKQMVSALVKIINEEEDSLRIYRIMEPREKFIQSWGREMVRNLEEPVIL
ncbi:MAG: CRISPR-associated endonuclease Cas2 [Candidatus Hatepunaea meridiana]|nr:CRISPR-associated endonuclease Cas2 [Candidatus Hatepunaea meridiana]